MIALKCSLLAATIVIIVLSNWSLIKLFSAGAKKSYLATIIIGGPCILLLALVFPFYLVSVVLTWIGSGLSNITWVCELAWWLPTLVILLTIATKKNRQGSR